MSGRLFRSPARPDGPLSGRSVFLAGSIEMGRAEMWQPRVAERFLSEGYNVFDPRRDEWDAGWEQDPTPGTLFERQVSWELDHIHRADLVFFRFGAEGPAIVSMLEAGLVIGRGKPVVILADAGYMRRGNLVITARRAGVPIFGTEEEAVSESLRLLAAATPQETAG